MNRRHFLTSATLAGLGISRGNAIGPINRKGAPRLNLGLAAYSFRDHMKWMKGKPNEKLKDGSPGWDILDFIDYCSDQGCPGAELTAYFFPPDCDEDYLLKVKRHAYLKGVTITGTAVGNSFTYAAGAERDKELAYVKEWIDKAEIMGAPHIRVFAGSLPKGMTQEQAEKNCLEAYQECLEYAAKKGVFLGLENHGGIVAEPDALIRLVEATNSPWAGINFDSANFKTDDPYRDLAKIAPYAVNTQLKMSVQPNNAKEKTPVDISRVIKILKDANYQGWFTLEYEEAEDPFVEVPKILSELKTLLAAG